MLSTASVDLVALGGLTGDESDGSRRPECDAWSLVDAASWYSSHMRSSDMVNKLSQSWRT